MKTIAGLLSLVAALGCGFEDSLDGDDIGTSEEAIIGGSDVNGEDHVVFLTTNVGACTGTLVGRRLVLTAAHCVVGSSGGRINFGDSTASFDEFPDVPVQRSLPHRRYQEDVVTRYDIAMIRLAEDAPAEVTPIGMRFAPLTDEDLGRSVRVIGFGVTDGVSQTGAGTKRQVTLTIDTLGGDHIGLGNDTKNICQGDSGGPTVLQSNGNQVLAVSSFGSNFCRNQSFVTRTDVFAEDFLREVLEAWGDGPCAEDGVCNEDCPEFGDPDCEPDPGGCSLDGHCASGCARVDLDCPLGGFMGDECANNDGCESRLCAEAVDDPRVKFCSQACEPGNPDLECPTPFACIEGVCKYEGITPTAQGAPCRDGRDCRSGLCDADDLICVEECTDNSQCSDPFSCEGVGGGLQVCTFPEGGCLGCGASSSGEDWNRQLGGGAAVLLLALLGFGLSFRRRGLRSRVVRH
jgi:V8-like Glu-specific endopeptidase